MKTDLVVNMVVFNNKKALLVSENNTFLKLPGGHVEQGENPETTVRREMKEELGCEIEFLDTPQLFNLGEDAFARHNILCTLTHVVDKDSSTNERHENFALVYVVKPLEKIRPMEGQVLKWVSQSDIESIELHPAIKAILSKAFSSLN